MKKNQTIYIHVVCAEYRYQHEALKALSSCNCVTKCLNSKHSLSLLCELLCC